jgi:hypothetical protein
MVSHPPNNAKDTPKSHLPISPYFSIRQQLSVDSRAPDKNGQS